MAPTLIFLAAAAIASPRIMSGAVEIRTATTEPAIIIAVDAVRDGRRDGVADAVYIYQAEDAVPEIHRAFASPEVEDFGDRLTITSEGRRLVFTVIGAEATQADESLTNGVGIARYWKKPVEQLRVMDDDSDWSIAGYHAPAAH